MGALLERPLERASIRYAFQMFDRAIVFAFGLAMAGCADEPAALDPTLSRCAEASECVFDSCATTECVVHECRYVPIADGEFCFGTGPLGLYAGACYHARCVEFGAPHVSRPAASP